MRSSGSTTHSRARAISLIGLFGAVSFLLMLLSIGTPFAHFLEYEPSDLPALLATFTLGPLEGFLVVLVRNCLRLLTGSWPPGLVMNLLASGTFVIVAGLWYRRVHTRLGAVQALALGTLAMTVVMIPANALFLRLFGFSEMVVSLAGSVERFLVVSVLPFNLCKGLVNSLFIYAVYKRLSPYIPRWGLSADGEGEREGPGKPAPLRPSAAGAGLGGGGAGGGGGGAGSHRQGGAPVSGSPGARPSPPLPSPLRFGDGTADGDGRCRVGFMTLGCRMNAHETEIVRMGLDPVAVQVVSFDEPADVYVINSCTVTANADRRTRNLIRSARRRAPKARIVVTGCSVQTRTSSYEAMPEVDYIRGNLEKDGLAGLVMDVAGGQEPPRKVVSSIWKPRRIEVPLIREYESLTRPFIKVQDGCDCRCSFCLIPFARGRSRSNPVDRVLEQARLFARAGHLELVLSGVQMGAYGRDLTPPVTLASMLSELVEVEGLARVRLSSIDPREFDEGLVSVLCTDRRICRHLHIPLQSGSDSVLERMGRDYEAADYRALLESIVERRPGFCIGADVIVGFPGETDEEFEATRQLVEASPLSYLHVFGYSPRPGTKAVRMGPQVPPETRKERSHILRELSRKKRNALIDGFVGDELEAIVVRTDDGVWALTDNYIEVNLEPSEAGRGDLVAVEIEARGEEVAYGRVRRVLQKGSRGTPVPAELATASGCGDARFACSERSQ